MQEEKENFSCPKIIELSSSFNIYTKLMAWILIALLGWGTYINKEVFAVEKAQDTQIERDKAILEKLDDIKNDIKELKGVKNGSIYHINR